MEYTYKLTKTNDGIRVEEIENGKSGNWWFISSLIMGEEHFINKLVSLDIELSDEDFKDHVRSFKAILNYVKKNHPELLL